MRDAEDGSSGFFRNDFKWYETTRHYIAGDGSANKVYLLIPFSKDRNICYVCYPYMQPALFSVRVL